MKLMVDNQLKVKVYNDKPNAKFKLAINHLSALSPDELKLVFGSNSTRAQWNPVCRSHFCRVRAWLA